jgi:anti-sigma factor RsiW
MMNCDTYQDLVAAHVDNALTSSEADEAQAHVRECDGCRRLFEEERQFRVAFAARRLIVPLPVAAEQRLHQVLYTATGSQPTIRERLRAWLEATPIFFRVASGIAVAGILLALLLPFAQRPTSPPAAFTRALHYYHEVTTTTPAVVYHTDNPQQLQAQFNGSGHLDFTTQVSDLRPAGYQLIGGNVLSEDGQPLAVSVYEEDSNNPLVCLRQRGHLPSLPEQAHDGHGHYWYSADGYTAMFTQFPDHFCVMISRQSKEAFMRRLQMPARAQTMR